MHHSLLSYLAAAWAEPRGRQTIPVTRAIARDISVHFTKIQFNRRGLKDRRTKDVRGVTGYDRRKWARRVSLDDPMVLAPIAPW